MSLVAPDKVRGPAVAVHDVNICAVRAGGEHSRAKASLSLGPPAMQEDESRAIGIEQQMIEVVLCIFRIAGDCTELSNIRDGDYQLPLAGFQIESEDARVLWCQLVSVGVWQACVAVAGSHIIDTPEIRRHCGATVGADGVNRIRKRSFLVGEDVKYVADEPVALPVVPDNFIF